MSDELFETTNQTVEDVPASEQPNALMQVIEAEQVEASTGVQIRDAFAPFFAEADEWRMKAQAIKVTDVSQKAEMAMARVIRLKLKDVRVNADKKRKELKEDSLRYGRAVQGAYNILEYLIAPLEKSLEEAEKFAEVQEAKRQAELKASREIQLAPWKEFVPFGLDLGKLGEEDFQKVLSGAKLQHQAKIDAEAKAEQERQERIKAEEAERARIAEENRRLREENEAKEKALAAEREAREKDLAAERAKAEEAEKAAEDLAAKQKAEADAKLAAERAEREKLEKELREKAAAEEAERVRQAQESERAAKAPDVEKIVAWTRTSWEFVSHVPTIRDEAMAEKVDTAAKAIAEILDHLRWEIGK